MNEFKKQLQQELKQNQKDKNIFNGFNTYSFDFNLIVKPDPNDPTETEEEAEKIANIFLKKISNNFKNNDEIEKKNTTTLNIENLKKYFDEYKEYKIKNDKISLSSIKSYNSSFDYLLYFINNNNNVNFDFHFFKNIQDNLQIVPQNRTKFKKYNTKNIDELKQIYKKDKYITLNNKTINNHIININTFFEYLKYNRIIKINECSEIKPLKESESEKNPFNDNDIIKIFNSDMESIYKNFCKMGIYTGMRIAEILNIKKIDIEDNFIKINDGKTKNAIRIIPIHPKILEIIENQIKENQGNFLFFDGEISKNSKNINRRIRKIIVEKEKTFHSFRKCFSIALETQTVADVKTKNYLLGHSFKKDITHTIYNKGNINKQKLIDAINQIEFNFLENNTINNNLNLNLNF